MFGSENDELRWKAAEKLFVLTDEGGELKLDQVDAWADYQGHTTGWIVLEENKPPKLWINPSPSQWREKPQPEAQRVGIINLLLNGRRVRWVAVGRGARAGFQNLIEQIEANLSARESEDHVPRVRWVNTERRESSKGSTFVPTWEVASWEPRPAALDKVEPPQTLESEE